MKKFLFIPALSLVLFFSFTSAPSVHAAACLPGFSEDLNGDAVQADGTTPCTVGANSGTSVNATSNQTCPAGQVQDLQTGNCASVSSTGEVTQQAPPTDSAAAKTATDPAASKSTEGFGVVMTWILTLFAWLVGVAALALNYAVYYTVVTMGDYVNHLSAIGVTWRILRDLGNILLIFGFLGVGISTILQIEGFGWSTKLLPKLLIAAVFMNFSLFITEAMIDGTNLVATQFYSQINGGVMPTKASLSATTVSNEGISNAIMNKLGLQTIYNTNTGKVNDKIFEPGNTWIIAFMAIILFLVTAFVMFALAFILIARFVALIFFIVFSPVALMGWAVPWLKFRMDQWWKNFLEQIITAPVLLLLLYVALAVITDAQFLTDLCNTGTCDRSWTGFLNPNNLAGFASLLLSFLIAIGLLLMVVIKAKSMSAFGADSATKMGGRFTFGATAFVGRRTVGRLSNYTAKKIRSSSIGQSEAGRMFASIADRGAKASFDVRGIKQVGDGFKKAGINAGDAQKGGYKGRVDELVKARTDYAKTIKQTSGQVNTTKAAKEAHDLEMKPLAEQASAIEAENKKVLKASRDTLKAKRVEYEAAEKSGDEGRRKKAKESYDLAKDAHTELVEEAKEKLEPVQEKIAAVKATLEKVTGDNSAKANQKKYAKNLNDTAIFGMATATGLAKKEAADKIDSEVNKDKNQQQLDRLEAILAKADKGDEKKPEEKS